MKKNNNFSLEIKECNYKDEHYSVREDGMVYRHRREGKPKRKLDEVWTFGTLNPDTGYLNIGSERVHRIVATAFHGQAPSDQHVVDHIDTNRQNNRPENLRWVTKLENILNNEITSKKVELICGSIEAFLKNPQLLYGHESEDKNFIWMRNVTKEEAQHSLANWSHWAKTASPNPNYKKKDNHIGDWIFSNPVQKDNNSPFIDDFMNKLDSPIYIKPHTQEPVSLKKEPDRVEEDINEEEFLYDSLTPSAKQDWRTPTEFPCCPAEVTDNGLNDYLTNLKVGVVFSTNNRYSPYYVVDKGFGKDGSLVVLVTDNKEQFLSWAITTIRIKDDIFVHENTMARAGKELTEKLFKHLIGQGKLSDDDLEILDCL